MSEATKTKKQAGQKKPKPNRAKKSGTAASVNKEKKSSTSSEQFQEPSARQEKKEEEPTKEMTSPASSTTTAIAEENKKSTPVNNKRGAPAVVEMTPFEATMEGLVGKAYTNLAFANELLMNKTKDVHNATVTFLRENEHVVKGRAQLDELLAKSNNEHVIKHGPRAVVALVCFVFFLSVMLFCRFMWRLVRGKKKPSSKPKSEKQEYAIKPPVTPVRHAKPIILAEKPVSIAPLDLPDFIKKLRDEGLPNVYVIKKNKGKSSKAKNLRLNAQGNLYFHGEGFKFKYLLGRKDPVFALKDLVSAFNGDAKLGDICLEFGEKQVLRIAIDDKVKRDAALMYFESLSQELKIEPDIIAKSLRGLASTPAVGSAGKASPAKAGGNAFSTPKKSPSLAVTSPPYANTPIPDTPISTWHMNEIRAAIFHEGLEQEAQQRGLREKNEYVKFLEDFYDGGQGEQEYEEGDEYEEEEEEVVRGGGGGGGNVRFTTPNKR